MKILSAVLFLIFGLTACGRIENFTNLTQQKIETEKNDAEQPDEPPILEIAQDAEGMFDVTGKTLFFNLYENGVIEFEDADEKKIDTTGKINKAEDVNVLIRAKITAEELKKFTDLLESGDFIKTNDEYQRKCCCVDTKVDIKISFTGVAKQKNINVSGYCDLYELEKPNIKQTGDFPQILSDLIRLAGITRLKYTPKNSSNQPE